MRKNLILALLLLSSITVSCHKKQFTQNEFEKKFNADWCNCLEEQLKEKTPEEIIFQVTANCVRNVMMQYVQDTIFYNNIRTLVAAKGYDDNLSDYEKERLFGRELGKKLLDNAADNCVVYYQSLLQFKKDMIEKAKRDANIEDKDEINKFIYNTQTELDKIDINEINNPKVKKQVSYYYSLLGLLYEYLGKEALAIEQYDKALQIDSENTTATVYKQLLVK